MIEMLALKPYEYWWDSFLPMPGQFIFCRKIRIIQMKRKKLTCQQSKCSGYTAVSFTAACVTHEAEPWLTSMVNKIGVLMIHQGASSIVSQHLSGEMRFVHKIKYGVMQHLWGSSDGEDAKRYRSIEDTENKLEPINPVKPETSKPPSIDWLHMLSVMRRVFDVNWCYIIKN